LGKAGESAYKLKKIPQLVCKAFALRVAEGVIRVLSSSALSGMMLRTSGRFTANFSVDSQKKYHRDVLTK
jgi:hypothetical protein